MITRVKSISSLVRFVAIFPLFLAPWLQRALAQGDVTPPTLLSVSVSPNPVDAQQSPQTVTIQLGASDNLSGVDFEEPQFIYDAVTFTSPSGNETINVRGATFSLVSGNTMNGVWQSTFTVSNYSESGAWTLTEVTFPDAVGNFQAYNATQLAALGLATTLTVESTPDTTPPQLTGLTLTPASVNVSAGPQTITATFTLTDNLSGVFFPTGANNSFVFQISSPSGKQSQSRSGYDFKMVSGIPTNGTWEITFPIPQYSEPGTWSIQQLTLQDAANNSVTLSAAAISALGLSPYITVASTPSDTVPPQLVSLGFSPQFINTSSSEQTVTVTLTATDNLSGVNWDAESPTLGFVRGVTFTSPSSQQSLFVGVFDELQLVAGTTTNGTWTGTLTFPALSEPGTWTPSVGMKDTTTNSINYDAAQIHALGSPYRLNNINVSGQSDGSVGSTGGTVTDSVFGSNAQITVPSGVLPPPPAPATAYTVAIDVLQSSSSPSVQTPRGFSTQPASFFVNISSNPPFPDPLNFPGVTVVLPLPTFMVPGTTGLELWRLDPLSGMVQVKAYNPQNPQAIPVNAIGTVNADGLSVTFLNVNHLSLLVGLQPTGTFVSGDVNGDGVVNCADMAIVQAAFGTRLGQPGYQANADLNSDEVINILDLATVARNLPAGLVCTSNAPNRGSRVPASPAKKKH
jgi:hypothetical protein